MEILTSVRRLYISFKSLVNDFVYSFGRAALLLLVEVQNHTVLVRERRRIRVKGESICWGLSTNYVSLFRCGSALALCQEGFSDFTGSPESISGTPRVKFKKSSWRLRLPDFETFSTWRWQSCQPYAPADFIPLEIFVALLEAESTPGS